MPRSFFDRLALRAVRRFKPRLDRFKLAGRAHVRAQLLDEPRVREAVAEHARATGVPEGAVWRTVDRYIREIVPFFSIVAYYQIGYRMAGWVLDLLYRVSVEYEDEAAVEGLRRDAIVVYLMNHRSNADYVVVSYVLAGQVALSYAVGEWARAFPLEHIFKSFGAYFVRRKYREPLYHAVLERYVQLITRNGVTQGIFLEGGLTRDGKLRPPKIGLLDYVLGIGHDPAYRDRMFVVPVAVNYDRVLEDRSLLRELASGDRRERPGKVRQLAGVARYMAYNVGRMATRRWRKYGRAAVTVGAPLPLGPWYREHPDLFTLPKSERLALVQQLSDRVMDRIGQLVPVTPVPLACAAIQSLGADFITREALLRRMEELRDVLVELNGRVVRSDRAIEETFDRAWRTLRMRRVLVEDGSGFVVVPRNRELVSYYANSIAHLLGPFERGVRSRDELPALAALTRA